MASPKKGQAMGQKVHDDAEGGHSSEFIRDPNA